jgi:hypothetical protein
MENALGLAFDHPEMRGSPALLSRQGELVSESMSGVVPEIRLGSEPRRADCPPSDLGGAGRAVFGEAAFVERALAILSRQDRPCAVPSPGAAPAVAGPILSQVAPSVSAFGAPATSSFVAPGGAPAAQLPGLPPTASAPPTVCPPSIETLRKQAVDWIDSLFALLAAGVDPTPVRTNLVAVGAGSSAAPVQPPAMPGAALPAALPGGAAALATLSMLPAGAGQVVATVLRIANDGALDAPLRFMATDLVGDSGARIPASAVTFVPAAAVVAAHAVRAIDVFVAIPAATPAGSYAGLLQLIGQPLARSLLAVDVTSEPASVPGARV